MKGLGQVQRQKSRQDACATEEKTKLRVKWHRHSCLCAVAEARNRRLAHPVASLTRDFHICSGSKTASKLTRRPSVVETVLAELPK